MPQDYFFTVVASADVTDGDDFNDTLSVTEPSLATNAGTVASGVSGQIHHTYTNIGGVPGLTEWDAGNYIAFVNVTSVGANVTYNLAIKRIDSSGSVVSTLLLGTDDFTTTGIKSITHNLASPLSVNAGDRLQVAVVVSRPADHGNQAMDVDVGTGSGNSSRLETPLTFAAPSRTVQHNVVNQSAMI